MAYLGSYILEGIAGALHLAGMHTGYDGHTIIFHASGKEKRLVRIYSDLNGIYL
jgi:hypothetical protein